MVALRTRAAGALTRPPTILILTGMQGDPVGSGEGAEATSAADERKARLLAEREDRKVRAQLRKEPLPDGVTLVRLGGRVAAVRVAVGRAELQTERDGQWKQLRLSEARRRRVQRARVVATDAELGKLSMRCYLPAEQGVADVGQRDSSAIGDLGNDPISGVIGTLMLIGFVLLSPYFAVRYARRCSVARSLARQLRDVPGVAAG